MEITVAICTWNRASLLRMTLERLTALRIPEGISWELLIVNNCCTDETDQVVQEYRDRLPLRRLYEPTPGLSHARNLALRQSKGEFILWTDDDVLVDERWLETLVDGCVQWKADVGFGRSEVHWLGEVPKWFSPIHYGRLGVLDYGDQPLMVRSDQPFFGLNFATRRESLLNLGGFDETLGYRADGGAGGEDTALFLRALELKMKVVYIPDAIVSHLIEARRGTKQFHRDRVSAAADRDFEELSRLFPEVSWFLGMPRFMFAMALGDGVGYVASTLCMARGRAFDYELKLLRFVGFVRAAGRRGYRRAPSAISRVDNGRTTV